MIDLGDPVVLSFNVTDASGNPANATAATITVTLPDASTSVVSNTNLVVGTYTGTYVTTQAGRHLVTFVATGTNACDQVDVFDVEAADPRLIIGLAEARKAIGHAAATAKDEDLRTYIQAVTTVVERDDMAGPVLKATRTWTVDGGQVAILLPSACSAVTSVTETGASLVPSVDYTVNLRAGILTRGNTLVPYRFQPGLQNVVITYTVGSSVIPANVRVAARIIVRQMWIADQQGRPPAAGAAGSDTVNTPSGYAIDIDKRAVILLRGTPLVVGGFA